MGFVHVTFCHGFEGRTRGSRLCWWSKCRFYTQGTILMIGLTATTRVFDPAGYPRRPDIGRDSWLANLPDRINNDPTLVPRFIDLSVVPHWCRASFQGGRILRVLLVLSSCWRGCCGGGRWTGELQGRWKHVAFHMG